MATAIAPPELIGTCQSPLNECSVRRRTTILGRSHSLFRLMRRTIFIGDIHGCFSELVQLASTLELTSDDDVICVGDLVNKGPYSAKVVDYVYTHQWRAVRGNHDQCYIERWRTDPYYSDIHDQLSTNAHNWFCGLPLYIETDTYLCVHAGLEPNIHPFHSANEVLMNLRTCTDGRPWYDHYVGSKPVIYGHWAAAGLTVRDTTIGLDSGCAYGGMLSAYILESGEIVQVPAQRVYQPIS